jgi:hypothetical protein
MIDTSKWSEKEHFEWQKENLKGAIQLAGQTIKSLEIVNGAGAISLLAFYGNVITQNYDSNLDGQALKWALYYFGLGVGSAVSCSILAYLSQRVVATSTPGEFWLFASGLACALGSAVLFILGVCTAGQSFNI